ncbi:MlaD family protein [Nocardia kruczakiae]|uniref:MlaD family protein n=1 Tax=Nocardia kruczakiae TaxID=261477 RepID=UPI0007A430BA|nr:MlaD family protein [Nocardia kruczakiae]
MASGRGRLWAAIKLAAVAVVTVLLFVIVLNAMRNPVEQSTRGYSAEFTDVSGLRVNGDVRLEGLRIGKVTGVELIHQGAGMAARVTFSMERRYQLTDTTTLAIKYQNLTGVRFIDVGLGAQPGKPVDHLSASATRPSFDITSLFNGLQPVLSTMNTDQINAFAENAIAVLQGDGGGLAPMLDSAQRLASYAQDRQRLISTLTGNVARIADSMGGRSPYVIEFLKAMSLPISNAMTVLDEFPKTASAGPALVEPIERLLAALGFRSDLDVDALVGHAFASLTEAVDSFRLMPGALAGLQVAHPRPENARCSNGHAHLPPDMEVLLNGSEVVLCNAK